MLAGYELLTMNYRDEALLWFALIIIIFYKRWVLEKQLNVFEVNKEKYE